MRAGVKGGQVDPVPVGDGLANTRTGYGDIGWIVIFEDPVLWVLEGEERRVSRVIRERLSVHNYLEINGVDIIGNTFRTSTHILLGRTKERRGLYGRALDIEDGEEDGLPGRNRTREGIGSHKVGGKEEDVARLGYPAGVARDVERGVTKGRVIGRNGEIPLPSPRA